MITAKASRKSSRLKEIRLAEALTKSELARRAGLSVSAITDAENGTRNTAEVTKHKILNALNENTRKKRQYRLEDIFS